MDKVNVGIIGCGNIFSQYIRGCRAFDILDVTACTDLVPERARARAEEFDIPRACTLDELLADPDIKVIINLTQPKNHAEISLAALNAGKHVYSEKPLAVHREDGARILNAAREKGLLVGCAPDTFLGGGHQTCRKLIDDGWIGQPVAAVAFMAGHGPESWHPDPFFFYQTGAGPMFDMGPYYLTALVNLLGPMRRITGSSRISFTERLVTSEPYFGQKIPVQTATHVAGVIDFTAGPVASIITSFDIWAANLPRIEIYGSAGSLSVPDPNRFGGPVLLRRAGSEAWTEVPLSHNPDVGRGIGVADLAYAVRTGRPQRAAGTLADHVLEAMHAFGQASETGRHVELTTQPDRPAPLPLDLPPRKLDGE